MITFDIFKNWGFPEQDKFKTIKYNGLISLLIEGVKELTKRVETCENKLNNKQ